MIFIIKDDAREPKPINSKLLETLEMYDILNLGDKFSEAGVTADIIWELEKDELMEEVKLSKIELRLFQKAQQKFRTLKKSEEGEERNETQEAAASTFSKFYISTVSNNSFSKKTISKLV